jgi:hypothetical protein
MRFECKQAFSNPQDLVRITTLNIFDVETVTYISYNQGVINRCLLSWLTNSPLVYEPKCGGVEGLGGLGHPSCAHRAQIYFGDLPPYLTYAYNFRNKTYKLIIKNLDAFLYVNFSKSLTFFAKVRDESGARSGPRTKII